MALINNRLQRTVTLCALYLAQGIPWGFMAIVLVSYLAERGLDETGAGVLSAIIVLPWTFKLIWAPLIDSVTVRSMGRRRFWIITAQISMAITLIGILWQGSEILTGDIDVREVAAFLAVTFFIHNCFASMQDVCTDALAVDILPAKEQGLTNGLMWCAKLIGKSGGAGLFAWIIASYAENGLLYAIAIQFFVLLLIMLLPLLLLEREGEKLLPWTRGEPKGSTSNQAIQDPYLVIRNLFSGFSLVSTVLFAMFGLILWVAFGSIEVLTTVFYPQQLGWTFDEFSYVNGSLAIIPILIGTIGGGLLGDRYGRRPMVVLAVIGFSISVVGFALAGEMRSERWFASAFLLVYQAFYAFCTVNFLAGAMNISWTISAASMFTVFMTLSNVGYIFGQQLAGPLVKIFTSLDDGGNAVVDYLMVFQTVGLISLISIVLLPFVDFAYMKQLKEGGHYQEPASFPKELLEEDSSRLRITRTGLRLTFLASVYFFVLVGYYLLYSFDNILPAIKQFTWGASLLAVLGLCFMAKTPKWSNAQSMLKTGLVTLLSGALVCLFIIVSPDWLGIFIEYFSYLAGFLLVVSLLLILASLRELAVASHHSGAVFSCRVLLVLLFAIFLVSCLIYLPISAVAKLKEVETNSTIGMVVQIIKWSGFLVLISFSVLVLQVHSGISSMLATKLSPPPQTRRQDS